uniref:Ubiquitin thioesterase otulin isoform X3 n=1 Tax=Petromyzon marinus TaxID=7757 RepID=A0AAJ7TSM2_PETMA|nr:ubiquitin thioesterase otulin isoform X3 [Petromyzon marinus]
MGEGVVTQVMASVDENSSLGGKVGARKTFDSSEVDLKSEVIPPNVVGDLSDTAVSNNHSDRLSIACKDCGTEEEQGDLTPKNSRQQCLLTESKSYVNSNENIASGSQPEESDLKEDAGTHDLSTENRAEAGGEPEMGQSFTGCIASKGFGDNFEKIHQREEDMYRSEGTIDKMPIGERRELVDYSCREWKGSTAKTKKIKKAYLELSGKGYFDIRRVRGDNYCGLRATLFQAFWKKIYIFDSTVKITELPHVLYQRNKGLIENWTFANREVKGRCNQASLVICLQNLENEWLKACTFEAANAENFCKDLFNQLGVTEWRLYEAVKLLMLWKAVDLYEMQQRGEDVPLFATLMFARETSLKPLSFLINHLNHVGSSGGLEQVEMCLLGYTLGITIRAFRLYMFGTEEFQVCYPESEPARGGGAVERPEVAIVTEDDRHYNVLLPSPNQPPCGHGEQPPLGHSKQRARSPHAL